VAWWHSYAAYNGYVASIFNGSSWQAQVTIDAGQSAGTASSRPPHLAVQPDGAAMVFFQQGNNGQMIGHLYATRLPGSGLAWESPVEVSKLFATTTNLGDGLAVDMDGNGNAVVAFQDAHSNYVFRAYQQTLGWQEGHFQVYNGSPGILNLDSPIPGEKSIALTPHEIIGVWQEQHLVSVNGVTASDGLGLFGTTAKKDVLINGYANQTASPIVNLQVILPYNDTCGTNSPYAYLEMRFSNDNNLWSAWQPAPPYPPGTTNITGWDLTASLYGGTIAGGLKRVYIQFRNSVCTDPVTTDDEIIYTGGSAGSGMDIGLRLFDGTKTNKIAAEWPAVSALRIFKNGTNYGIVLAATNSPNASKFRIQTASGIKALQKLP